MLGLSSYPYLGGFATPERIPLDYYARVGRGWDVSMMVVEGEWTSASVPGVPSSADLQARLIHRQPQLADEAKLLGVSQITFTDLDLSSYPAPGGSILPLFGRLGLVDASYRAKPALAVWDSALAVKRACGGAGVRGCGGAGVRGRDDRGMHRQHEVVSFTLIRSSTPPHLTAVSASSCPRGAA